LFRSRNASAPRASLFDLVVLLHYSTVISKLSDENRPWPRGSPSWSTACVRGDEDEDG
jgi:hypothetical protein